MVLLHVAAALFSVTLFAPCGIKAQPRFEYRAQLFTFEQRTLYVAWQLEDSSKIQEIRQTYLPAVFDFAVSRNTQVAISAAGGFSNVALPDQPELNSLTDTRIRVSHRLANNRWLLGVGANLPSGKSKLNEQENFVVDALTQTILGFPLQRPGVGLDWEFSIAHAANLSETLGLGFGGTAIVPGEFEYRLENTERYRPGNRYSVTLVLNNINQSLTWRLHSLAQFFDDDQLDGRDYFRQGWQFEQAAALAWNFAPGWRLSANLLHLRKADNAWLAESQATSLPTPFYLDNSTYANFALGRSLGRRTQLEAHFSWNHFGESNQQLDRARIWRTGLSATGKISEHFILGANGDVAGGSAEAGAVALRGYGLSLWLRAQL